jgi:Protein of unknown function (DUF2587)
LCRSWPLVASDDGLVTIGEDARMTDKQHIEVERGTLVEPVSHAAPVPDEVTETIGQPGKVMRIGSMVKQLLDEVRAAPLDEASRNRLAAIYDRSVTELATALSPDLQTELRNLAHPFGSSQAPSDAELRIAQAQLVGWLEGLFHGIQATLFAQQLAAQQQLGQMRGELPPGAQPTGTPAGVPIAASDRPGTYL